VTWIGSHRNIGTVIGVLVANGHRSNAFSQRCRRAVNAILASSHDSPFKIRHLISGRDGPLGHSSPSARPAVGPYQSLITDHQSHFLHRVGRGRGVTRGLGVAQGVGSVNDKLHPPAIMPEFPDAKSTTYRLQTPLACVPPNIDAKVALFPPAGPGWPYVVPGPGGGKL